MQLAQRLAKRPLAAVLSLSGVLVLLLASRLNLWPFVAVGIVILVITLAEEHAIRIAPWELGGSLVTWAFTAWLFYLAYTSLVRHDSLQMLPELYTMTAATSLAGGLIFAGGILDWTRKPPRTEVSHPS